MAGAAFAGGAFVQLQLKGTDQVGSELDAMASDMKKFKKLARDVSQNFGVEAAVDSLGNFTVKGNAANAAARVLADELQRMEGIQARTAVTVKNVNKELAEQAAAEQKATQLTKSAAETKERLAKKEADRVARQKANIEEFQRSLKFQSKQYEIEYNKQQKAAKEKEEAIERAQEEAWQRTKRRIENEQSAKAEALREEERKKKAAIEKYQKMLKFNSKVAEDKAKEAARAQAEAAKKAERAQAAAEKKKAANTKKSVQRRIALLKKLTTIEKKSFNLQKLAVGVRTIGTLANAVAGLVTQFSDVASAVDKVGKAANRAGTSVEFMSGLRFAAEQSGASFEQLSAGMKAMQRNLGGFAMGTGEAVAAFDALGVSYSELEGMTPEDQFLKLTDLLAGVEDANVRARLATQMFGEGGQELANMLENGTNGIRAYREQADALGITMSQEQTEGAAKFNDSLNILMKTFEMIKSKIVAAMGPALEELAFFFNGLVQVVMEWDEGLNGSGKMADWFMGIVEVLKTVLYSLVAIWYELNGVMQGLIVTYNRSGQALYSLIASMSEAFLFISQSVDGLAEKLGLDVSSSAFFESMRDQARQAAAEYERAADIAEAQMGRNQASAEAFWNAAFNPDESVINQRVEATMEDAREATENVKNTAPVVELSLDDESKNAIADFSSGTEYGVEGVRKAEQQNEQQTNLLRKIANNTAGGIVLAGA